jgi:hypothetical protein
MVQSNELLHVFRINAAVITAGLPGFAGVVTGDLRLNLVTHTVLTWAADGTAAKL